MMILITVYITCPFIYGSIRENKYLIKLFAKHYRFLIGLTESPRVSKRFDRKPF